MKYCVLALVLALLSLAAATGVLPILQHTVPSQAQNDALCESESVDAMPEVQLPPAEPTSVEMIPKRELAPAEPRRKRYKLWKFLFEVVFHVALACLGLPPRPFSALGLIVILILSLEIKSAFSTDASYYKGKLDAVQQLHQAEIFKHVHPHTKALRGILKPLLVVMGTALTALAGFVYPRRMVY
jgi:hypothetical protein